MSETVGALITVFNGERFLAEAVESILAQTRPVDEIVVLNDGSTDGTARVAASFGHRIRYLEQENRGIGFSRQRLVNACRCDYLAFLDADDVWLPDKTELQLAAFRGDPALEIVFGHMRCFRDNGEERRLDEPRPGILPSAKMMKRNIWERVGLSHVAFETGEYVEWLISAREMGIRERLIPEVVAHRRIHGANVGLRDRGSQHANYLKSIRARLARRRSPGAEQAP